MGKLGRFIFHFTLELHAHALTIVILKHFAIFCLTLHFDRARHRASRTRFRDRAQLRVQQVSENKEWHFVMRILGASAAYAESRGARSSGFQSFHWFFGNRGLLFE